MLFLLPFMIHGLSLKKEFFKILKENKYYFILSIYTLLGLLWTEELFRGMYLVYNMIVAPFIAMSLIRTRNGLKVWRNFSWSVLLLSLLLHSDLLKVFFNYYEVQRFAYYYGDISLNPNSFGLWLNLSLAYFITIGIKLYQNKNLSNFRLLILIMNITLTVYFMVITVSRSTMIAGIVAVFLLIIISKSKLVIVLTSFLVSFTLLCVLITLNMDGSNQGGFIIDRFSTLDLNGREDIWGIVFNTSFESPDKFLFGVGTGGAEKEIGSAHSEGTVRISDDGTARTSTHNVYLLFLLQGGVVGIFIYLMFLINLFKLTLTRIKSTFMHIGILYLITTFAIMSLTGNLIYNPIYPFLIAIALALLTKKDNTKTYDTECFQKMFI
ncbi:hypothetical protein BLL40_05015 [Domibacillus mangrovi]|uniref:O-antigen ligase-related domain-containing protein n=2 Tax=Domibacillus mangrovi TaxID=1714354 RepID=A0A1Q5P6E2_9BACI|nr:hypothetical protein BLL40_05015 [Domibacillus mangrovi]